ncbi:phage baseplate assembly protein V, partial [Acinetobacter baumannii]|uniref:phage baseplate assembly protein V n=1 Tax=Acinetobacter baumannii TaxID=470 RepID=UPI003EDB4164
LKVNSANFHGLGKLEELIKKIGPPKWPWAVDKHLARKGALIFARKTDEGGCVECHGIRIKDLVLWDTPLRDVGSDRRQHANDTDSAWIDVLTPWAGEGYGARFLPRIGEIVVIDFFNGDIDRPFVMGRIHEAQRHPTKFDNKGKLPDTKKLSGIRSKEVSG